jgi:hypothetical protein
VNSYESYWHKQLSEVEDSIQKRKIRKS